MINNPKQYWNNRYNEDSTSWNIGYAAPAIVEYMKQVTNKGLKILIPGCGFAHEVRVLYEFGFKNIYILDISESAIAHFKKNNTYLSENQIINEDFFDHHNKYDLILEHTFFCAIPTQRRQDYVCKAHNLLAHNGKLVGLLFNINFNKPTPPFGGNKLTYETLFSRKFRIKTLELAINSIKPRQDSELFFIFEKI